MVNDHSHLLRQQGENNTNSSSVFAINLIITLIYILRKFIVGNLLLDKLLENDLINK